MLIGDRVMAAVRSGQTSSPIGRSAMTIIAMGFCSGVAPVVLKTLEGLSATRPAFLNVGRSLKLTSTAVSVHRVSGGLADDRLDPLILRSIAKRDASRRIEATAGPSWFETARHGEYRVGMVRMRSSSP